jgi:hypothetical protein
VFIGHWAPALAVAARPKAPALGLLFIAAQLVDWAFFGLLLTGMEHMRVTPGISAMNLLCVRSGNAGRVVDGEKRHKTGLNGLD